MVSTCPHVAYASTNLYRMGTIAHNASFNATVHPADITILEPIDARLTRYEEESGTVFLARDLMERLQKMTMALRRRSFQQTPTRSRLEQLRQPRWS